jgi:DNA-binding transcriptional ArsR family regulator
MFTPVHAFDVLGDPVRRRILDLIAGGELSSGAITEVVQEEFGISQPAVSQHLKVLRDAGLVTPRQLGRQRMYSLEAEPLQAVYDWCAHYRRFWDERLDRLGAVLDRVAATRRER